MDFIKNIKNYLSLKYLLIILIVILLAYTYTKSKYMAQSDVMGQKNVANFLTEVELTVQSYNIALEKNKKNLANAVINDNKSGIKDWIDNFNKEAVFQLKINDLCSFILDAETVYTSNKLKDNVIKSYIEEKYFNELIGSTIDQIGFLPLFSGEDGEYFFIIYKKFMIEERPILVGTILPINQLKKIWFDSEIKDTEQVYYLVDKASGLVFTTYNMDPTYAFLNKINLLINDLKEEKTLNGVVTRSFSNGITYSIYYQNSYDNNFMSLVVIPKQFVEYSIYKNMEFYIYVIVCFVLLMVVFYINDIKNSLKTRRYIEFVKLIGDAYYAIFSINLKADKYAIIKGTDEMNKYLPHKGEYSHLHKILCTVVEKGCVGDFTEYFSIENIRELTKEGKIDFGGDFQRMLDNGYKWVQIRLLYNKDVSKEYAVLAFRERDDERKKELERMELLETSVSAMKKANTAKNVFYSGLSHDMRTPLNAIIGLTELLEQDIENKEKIKDYVEKIRLSGKQLLSLIDNFLDYTKKSYISEDGKDESCVDFQLKEYLESNLSIYKIVAEKEKKDFSINYDIIHNDLNGDTTKLYRIINNLISNSFKYTKAGDKISLTVTEIKNQGRPKFRFDFTDTGIGMDKEFLQQVYDPYKREKRFETKETAGLGLGMAIVENYVRYLNGEIFIESKVNEGTKVNVTLAFDISGQDSYVDNNLEESNEDVQNLNVLIAEDNDVNMFIVTELLTRNGHNVTKAYNGQQAIDIFLENKENTFDIILMDIQMPILNGLEAAKALRQIDRDDAKTIPIIAVSAYVYTEDVAASNKAGMNAHLAKPINYNMLQKTFNSLIKKRNK